MNKKTVDIILWSVLFAILVLCLWIVVLLKNETTQCIDNAFIYGAKEQVEGDVMCSCVAIDGQKYSEFYFNESTWWTKPMDDPVSFYP